MHGHFKVVIEFHVGHDSTGGTDQVVVVAINLVGEFEMRHRIGTGHSPQYAGRFEGDNVAVQRTRGQPGCGELYFMQGERPVCGTQQGQELQSRFSPPQGFRRHTCEHLAHEHVRGGAFAFLCMQ